VINLRGAAVFLRGRTQTMGDEPVTSSSLLIRLRDRGNHATWSQFVAIYQPLQ